jgi:hypothetical protein
VSLREDDHWVWRSNWIESNKLNINLWTDNMPFALAVRVYDARGIRSDDYALTVLEKLYMWRALSQFKKANRTRLEADLVATIVSRRLNTKEKS